jgi:hypothetical protein
MTVASSSQQALTESTSRWYRAICGGDPEITKRLPNLSYDVVLIGYRLKGSVFGYGYI